jgi:hypothetical protein
MAVVEIRIWQAVQGEWGVSVGLECEAKILRDRTTTAAKGRIQRRRQSVKKTLVTVSSARRLGQSRRSARQPLLTHALTSSLRATASANPSLNSDDTLAALLAGATI